MDRITTAKSPSVFKAGLVFAAAAALVALSSRAPAQDLSPAPRAYAGEPSVRMRGADAHGLTAISYADWLATHPESIGRPVHGHSGSTLFDQANAGRDGGFQG